VPVLQVLAEPKSFLRAVGTPPPSLLYARDDSPQPKEAQPRSHALPSINSTFRLLGSRVGPGEGALNWLCPYPLLTYPPSPVKLQATLVRACGGSAVKRSARREGGAGATPQLLDLLHELLGLLLVRGQLRHHQRAHLGLRQQHELLRVALQHKHKKRVSFLLQMMECLVLDGRLSFVLAREQRRGPPREARAATAAQIESPGRLEPSPLGRQSAGSVQTGGA
jgi:hypothetical protein